MTNDKRRRDEGRPTAAPGGPTKPTGPPQMPGMGLAFDLGLRLAISVALGLGAGLFIDGWLKTSPLFTLVGMILGIAAAMYTIWDVARQGFIKR